MKSGSAFCLLLFVLIAGLSPAGAAPTLVYSTWLGGWGVDMAVDSAGNAVVLGSTGEYSYFLAKLSPSGELIFQRPLELPLDSLMKWREIAAVALDPAGYIYLAGAVEYDSCPDHDPYTCSPDDSYSGFVAKLGPDGTGLLFDTIFSEGYDTQSHDLAVDEFGRAYIHYTSRWPDKYGYEWSEGISFSPAGAVENFFGFADGQWAYVTALAMGPPRDLYSVGWQWPWDYEGYTNPVAYLQRKAAPSGAVTFTVLDDSGTIFPLDVAGGPGGVSVVAGRVGQFVDQGIGAAMDPGVPKAGDLYIAEFGPAGEKVFSRVLDLGVAEVLDVVVTSSGQIILLVTTGSGPLALRLEGGTGEILSSIPSGWTVAVGPGGDVYTVRNGYVSRYTENRPPVCSSATATPSTIWPPDRRQVRISTLGVTDPDGDPVTLKVTRILQDELFTARMADAGSLGTAKPWVRADRMDNGDGRVYHLFFEATDPVGAKCTGEVKVCVPIQSGGTCRDGGARFDSTVPR